MNSSVFLVIVSFIVNYNCKCVLLVLFAHFLRLCLLENLYAHVTDVNNEINEIKIFLSFFLIVNNLILFDRWKNVKAKWKYNGRWGRRCCSSGKIFHLSIFFYVYIFIVFYKISQDCENKPLAFIDNTW